MADRTFLISIKNLTGRTWDRQDVGLNWGVWSQDGLPSEHWGPAHFDDSGDVVPGTDWFMSESDGFATGTEGWVDYTSQGLAGTLHIHWNNPFVGGNQFTASGPDGINYNWGDPGGNHASIELQIEKRQ
jgi:hypothetical protein